MISPLPAALAGGAALVYWSIGVATARRRRVVLGGVPWLPVVTAAAAALFSAQAAGRLAEAAALGAVAAAAAIDARTGYIFDSPTAIFGCVSLVFAGVAGDLPAGIAGAVIAGGAMLLPYVLTRGAGLGLGDVKLAAGIGAALGAPAAITALGIAFIAGGAYATWLLLRRRATKGSAVRFGPFLAGGTFAVALLPALVQW